MRKWGGAKCVRVCAFRTYIQGTKLATQSTQQQKTAAERTGKICDTITPEGCHICIYHHSTALFVIRGYQCVCVVCYASCVCVALLHGDLIFGFQKLRVTLRACVCACHPRAGTCVVTRQKVPFL